jgi:hypothetical protein
MVHVHSTLLHSEDSDMISAVKTSHDEPQRGKAERGLSGRHLSRGLRGMPTFCSENLTLW